MNHKKYWESTRVKGAYRQGRADVIEEALSKVRNLVNTECNPSCECQPDCLYLEALGDVVGILNQLRGQK